MFNAILNTAVLKEGKPGHRNAPSSQNVQSPCWNHIDSKVPRHSKGDSSNDNLIRAFFDMDQVCCHDSQLALPRRPTYVRKSERSKRMRSIEIDRDTDRDRTTERCREGDAWIERERESVVR